MSDQQGPVASQPQTQNVQQSQQIKSQNQSQVQQSNGPQAVQIQDDNDDQGGPLQAQAQDDANEIVLSEQDPDDQEDQNNNQKLQQSQNQSNNNPSLAKPARQQSTVKIENNSSLQPKSQQLQKQQSSARQQIQADEDQEFEEIGAPRAKPIQNNSQQIKKQQSSARQQIQAEDQEYEEIGAPRAKPIQNNKIASSKPQQSDDLAKSRNVEPQPKKATLLRAAEPEKPKQIVAAPEYKPVVAKQKSKPKAKPKSGKFREPDFEVLLYTKDNKKIYWTNQTEIHPDDGVDIGFRVGDDFKYHMPEIKNDNAGYVVKLFYNLAKQYFTNNDNLYLCFPRGGQKGKLQFARNLFYVMGFDYLENNVDIFEASGAVTICLQETKLYNEKFAGTLDEFTNCQMVNLYRVEGFDRIQDRDTIDIILQIMKLKTKSKEFPKITLADINEKEVDKILKDYTKINSSLSKK